MMTGILGRSVARAAIFFERYGLSLIFFYYAWEHANWILASKSEFELIQAHPVIEIFRQVVWLLFDIFTGLVLLFGRRVAVLPKDVKDLLVPLVTTFFYLLYEASRHLPAWLSENPCPMAWQAACLTGGLFLNFFGLSIAIWSTLSLGRSFGVLIEVRKVVTEGAYQWVRHPIYFGYLFFISGFLATNFSIAFFILVPVHIALMVYRARLEETRLAEFSPEYREYQKRTGFLFPKFRKP
jgi:protein-S-isoprenylcysteine O-methyltransferase Ste14